MQLANIDRDKVLALKIKDDQREFISDNAFWLLQADRLNNWHGYTAVVDGATVGFTSYASCSHECIRIYKLMIDAEHQGRHYGKQLLDLIIGQILFNENTSHVCLTVGKGNKIAIDLYTKYGFSVISESNSAYVMMLPVVSAAFDNKLASDAPTAENN